jgi:hypothetical protein
MEIFPGTMIVKVLFIGLSEGDANLSFVGGTQVSIVRVGLAETKHFAEGYETIFGKKRESGSKKSRARPKGAKTRAKKSKKKSS